MSNQQRSSNFELLRIFSMLLIVMSHCDDIFGLYPLYNKTLGVYKVITDLLHLGGQIGVGCFLLITGYFMIMQKFSLKKLAVLVATVWFYSVGFLALWVILKAGQGQLQPSAMLQEVFPALFPILSSGPYWFVAAYLILMLLSPFLNRLLLSLDQASYARLLMVIILIFVVIMGGIPGILPAVSQGRLIPVFVFYSIGGYIRRFRSQHKGHKKRYFMIAAWTYLILFGSSYLITYLGIRWNNPWILQYRYFYRSLESPLVVLICVSLFLWTQALDIPYQKWINRLGRCTLGVYLIHGNRLILRFLPHLFPIYRISQLSLAVLCIIAGILLIYGGCTLLELFRKEIIEPRWRAVLERYCPAVEQKVQRWLDAMAAKMK